MHSTDEILQKELWIKKKIEEHQEKSKALSKEKAPKVAIGGGIIGGISMIKNQDVEHVVLAVLGALIGILVSDLIIFRKTCSKNLENMKNELAEVISPEKIAKIRKSWG